jgi:histidinol phosphatase-like enzyme
MDKLNYQNWLTLRKESIDEHGDKFCYCGHTNKCSCADPDITLFNESIQRGVLNPNDPNNGWTTNIENEQ